MSDELEAVEENEDPNLTSLREALDAAKRALKIMEEQGDNSGALKAARAIADISQKIVRLMPEGELKATPGKRVVLAEVEKLLGELVLSDYETRKQTAESLGYLTHSDDI